MQIITHLLSVGYLSKKLTVPKLTIMARRNRNRKQVSRDDVRAVGFDFIELLEENNWRTITERDTLKKIYNENFRDR